MAGLTASGYGTSLTLPNEPVIRDGRSVGSSQQLLWAIQQAVSPDSSRSLQAAADFLGNGAIEVNMYETEIADIVRRESETLNRVNKVPATGQPHRYFEQTAIATATWTDPRAPSPTPSSPTRVERSAVIKATTNQTNFTLFDPMVTKQQGQYGYLEAKDIADIASSITVLEAGGFWTGTDTSLVTPTTNQFVGVLTQITQQFTIANGSSIIDGLTGAVASMITNNPTYKPRPTSIYLNQSLQNLISVEAKASHIELGRMDIGAGVTVKSIGTVVGDLPLIPDVYLPNATGAAYGFSAPPAGLKNYFAAIVTDAWVEMPFVMANNNYSPMIFQLGLLNSLQGQFVGIHFPAVIVKGPSYSAAVVCIQRP